MTKRTELGKLGLFFMFLMTADSTRCPPHSTTRLGDDTAASWYGFMFLRPQTRICEYTHTEKALGDFSRLSQWKVNLQAGSHLHSCELNHGPDALRNHVEVLSSLWGDQGKVRVSRLQSHINKKSVSVKSVGQHAQTEANGPHSERTLFLRMSSAATSASPAFCPLWMMGCHSSLGTWSMPGLSFTTGAQTLRPSNSSFPCADEHMATWVREAKKLWFCK